MYGRERRKPQSQAQAALRAGLTPAQSTALDTLEHFRWTLKFVRRPMFQDPIPVVVHPDGERHAILEPDGSISAEVMYDYLHPTAKGYAIWSAAMAPTLDRMLVGR